MTALGTSLLARNHAAVMEELRRLMPRLEGVHATLPFGLAAIDSYLPGGGLVCGALHEIVPDGETCRAAALGFIASILARLSSPPSPRGRKTLFVVPAYARRPHGRLSGHGLAALGFDPTHLILVETAHRKETLWAVEEALRSGAPQAVAAEIDTLDLKASQRLHLAATDAGLPLFLLRPAPPSRGAGWASAATTRWRVGTVRAARNRFGLITCPRWHLQLERCRNGRPGEWVVEYDHVAHRFSLAAALADPALSRRTTEKSLRHAG